MTVQQQQQQQQKTGKINKNTHTTDWPPVAISVFRDDWQLQLTTNWLRGRRSHIHRHARMHIPHLITWTSWSFPIPLTCHLWAVHNHTDSAVPRVIHSYTEFHFYQWSFRMTLTFHLYQWSHWLFIFTNGHSEWHWLFISTNGHFQPHWPAVSTGHSQSD